MLFLRKNKKLEIDTNNNYDNNNLKSRNKRHNYSFINNKSSNCITPDSFNPYINANPAYPPMLDSVKPDNGGAEPAKLARTQAIIINDIKVLRERFAAGAIDQENYMKSLDRLNDELLSQYK